MTSTSSSETRYPHRFNRQGIDYNKQSEQADWIPLELFDDTNYDDYSNQDWIKKGEQPDGSFAVIAGKGLYQDEEDLRFYWRDLYVEGYDEKEEKFIAFWQDEEHNKKLFKISRINLLFEAEDPQKFARRVAKAHQERIYADSLIRYNYYIDNMPKIDLQDTDQEQKNRLMNLTQNTQKLKEEDLADLLQEVDDDYSRTMNKIIFDKCYEDGIEQFIPLNLRLPPVQKNVPAPEYGMIIIERDDNSLDFTDIFKEFCFKSLYIKKQVIHAL
jgi:dynein heavy chain, axonemal